MAINLHDALSEHDFADILKEYDDAKQVTGAN